MTDISEALDDPRDQLIPVAQPLPSDDPQEVPVGPESAAETPLPAPAPATDTGDPEDPRNALAPLAEEFTRGEKAIAAGQGAVAGATRGGAVTSGIIAGAIAMGPVPIPGARIIGGIVGGIGGYFLGEEAVETLADVEITEGTTLTFRSIEDVPEELRPFAVFGEVVGGAVTFTGAAVGVAKRGVKIVINPAAGRLKRFAGNLFNGIMESARTRTARFVATETSAAVSAGAFGAGAEVVAPGEAGIRLGAEVVGGITSPTRLILGAGTDIVKGTIRMVRGMSSSARQTKAGQKLQSFIEDSGGDPALFAALLRGAADEFPRGAKPTVAQALGDPVAAAFEAELKEINREFGVQAATQARQTIDAISTAIVLLRNADADPATLIQIGKMREQAYRALLDTRIENARETATRAAQEIVGDLNDATRSTISKAAEDALSTSLKGARTVETSLYNATESVNLRTMNVLLKEHTAIRAEMLEADRLPAVIEKTIESYRAAQDVVRQAASKGIDPSDLKSPFAKKFLASVGLSAKEFRTMTSRFTTDELVKFRGTVLDQARKADREGLTNLSRRLGNLAEATMNQIDIGYRGAIRRGDITRQSAAAYDTARSFSRSLHDTFTRAFGGTATLVGRRGELQTPPEALLHSALSTGSEMRALRMQELELATRFLITQADNIDITPKVLEGAVANSQKMFDSQQSFLRLAAAEVVGKDGRASAQKVFDFMRKNEEMLERFPVVRDLLTSARTSEEALQALEDATKRRLQPSRLAQNAFARVARVESGADAIKNALNDSQPQQRLSELANLARKGGPRELQGLRASIWDHIIDGARRTDGTGLSLPKLIVGLTDPIRPGLPSLLDTMVAERLMSKQDADRVGKLIDMARGVVRAIGTQPTGEMILGGGAEDITGSAASIMLRMMGATVATEAASMAPGTATSGRSLIVAGAGARFSEQLFKRLPKLQLQEILKGALRGDALVPGGARFGLAEALLEVPKSPRRAIELSRQIHAYAITGLHTYVTSGDEYLDPDEDLDVDAEAEFDARDLLREF